MDNRWKILLLLFCARIGLGFQFQVLGSVSPTLVDEFSFSYGTIGLLVGFFMLAGIFLSFPAGLAHRIASDRTLVTFGLLLLAMGGLMSASGSGFMLIGLGRIVSGAGFVFGTLYFAKMVTDWFAGKELATAMGILVMSWPVGIALGQILHPLITSSLGFETAFIVASVYCFLAGIAMSLLYRKPILSAAEEQAISSRSAFTFEAIHWKLTLIAASIWGLFNAGYVVYLSFSAKVLMEAGYEPNQAALIASIPSWGMIISVILVGQIVDRTGKRDLVFYGCTAAAAISMILLGNTMMVYLAVALFGLLGIGSAGVIMALTGESMPASARAFGMGIFFTVYFLIQLPAPALAGWFFDITGDSSFSLYFASALFSGGAVLNILFRNVQRRADQATTARV